MIADKAYSSRGIRTMLRERGITAVIPQPADQIRNRTRRGSAGGRPPAFDPIAYKGRNVIERSFNDHKQWRGIATRYYTPAVHRASFALPAYVLAAIGADGTAPAKPKSRAAPQPGKARGTRKR